MGDLEYSLKRHQDVITGKRKLQVMKKPEFPVLNPDEFSYVLDIDDIEREIESPFTICFDKTKNGWWIGIQENPEWPQFMICYMLNLKVDEFERIIQTEFGAYNELNSMDSYFKTKENAINALEWMESMLVMAAMEEKS